jgi:O-phosphoseryl-tRNA(Cys) synthetase
MSEDSPDKISRPERRLEAQAARMRREMDQWVAEAVEAEIVTDEIENRLWTKIIKPYIQRTLTAFQGSVYSLPPDEFVKQQGVANGLNGLLVWIEGKVGKKQECLDEAERIKQKLEQAEREGRIRRSPEEMQR